MASYQYDLIKRIEELEKRLHNQDVGGSSTGTNTPGYQMLPNGVPFFPSGYAAGASSHVVYEPYVLPPATGVTATWGSSFDTIYIDVTWNAPTAYGSNMIASYLVQATKQGSVIPIETTVSSGATTTRIQPVEPNTTYAINVAAQSRNGRNSVFASTSVTTGGDTSAPAAPTFPATPVTPGIEALAIKWNANTERDVANGAGTYRLVVSTNSNLSSPAYSEIVAGTYAWVGNLTAGTNYYVGVYARDSSGNQSPVANAPGGPWAPLQNVTTDVAFAFGGANYFKDSSFELPGNTIWNAPTAGWNRDPVNYRYGTKSLTNATAGTNAYVEQDALLPKGTYVVSVWAKAGGVVSPSLGVMINYDVLSGTVVNPTALEGGTIPGGQHYLVMGAGTFDWKRGAMRFEVTSTQANVRFYLQRQNNAGGQGQVWFDGAQLEEGEIVTMYAPRPDEILPGTITATEIADNGITTPKLAALSVVAGKIAANAVGANEIVAASITGGKIAANTITATNILANTITATQIAADTITGNEISIGAIHGGANGELAATTVTADNLVATLGIQVGKHIQSIGYSPQSSGWRIQGDGNAEFNSVDIRSSAFIGGRINIANRILTDVEDETIHCAANIRMGGNYSGTLYSGDKNWGFQVGNNGFSTWSDTRFYMEGTNRAGFRDTSNNAIIGGYRPFEQRGNGDTVKQGGRGVFIAQAMNQFGTFNACAIVTRAAGDGVPGGSADQTGLGFEANGQAAFFKLYAPLGNAIEVRNGNDSAFAPLKASAFIVNSARASKENIRELDTTTRDKIKKLKPVRFNRPASSVCAFCHGTGKMKVSHFIPNHEDPTKDQYLEPGDKCHLCKGKKNADRRNAGVKKFEDTDFLGLVADEVAEHFPEAVVWEGTNKADLKATGIDYAALCAVLVAQVQQLEDRLEQLEQK